MKYDDFIKTTTKTLNKQLSTKYTDKQVFIALQYPLSESGIISRFMDYYGDLKHMRYDVGNNVFEMYAKADDDYRYKWHQVRFANLKKLLRIMIKDALISADIVTDVNNVGIFEQDGADYSRNAIEFVRFYSDELEISNLVEKLKNEFIRRQKLAAEARAYR